MNGMNEALSTMPANAKGDTATAHNRAGGAGGKGEQLLQLVARCVWLVNALCEDAGCLRGTRCGQQHVWGRDEIR